jgi:hypothetical protein
LTDEGLKRSIECFKKAIELGPRYGLAYAGLVSSVAPHIDDDFALKLRLPDLSPSLRDQQPCLAIGQDDIALTNPAPARLSGYRQLN